MQKQKHHHNNYHEPVLLDEVLEMLKPEKGESYLDLTAGYGGHARAVINLTKSPERATLVDRDQSALDTIKDLESAGATLVHSDFASYTTTLAHNMRQFDLILIDLGVSSPQLDRPERGFSFQTDGPLDMRMDQSQNQTAADLIRSSTEAELKQILQRFGDEPKAGSIAKALMANPPETTLQLAQLVEQTIRRRGKTHPATRTFQALRIAVNDELQQVALTLPLLPDILTVGGRVAIISFHSLEDRLVKSFLQEEAKAGYEARMRLINKKPLSGAYEKVHNPRSRSARLRAGVKINTQ